MASSADESDAARGKENYTAGLDAKGYDSALSKRNRNLIDSVAFGKAFSWGESVLSHFLIPAGDKE